MTAKSWWRTTRRRAVRPPFGSPPESTAWVEVDTLPSERTRLCLKPTRFAAWLMSTPVRPVVHDDHTVTAICTRLVPWFNTHLAVGEACRDSFRGRHNSRAPLRRTRRRRFCARAEDNVDLDWQRPFVILGRVTNIAERGDRSFAARSPRGREDRLSQIAGLCDNVHRRASAAPPPPRRQHRTAMARQHPIASARGEQMPRIGRAV